MIRHADRADLPSILNIYEEARKFMAENGNASQWGGSYPPENLVGEDIEKGRLYVYITEGYIRGVFMFAIGEDLSYGHIENGSWISQDPYGVIHRVASDGTAGGVLRTCIEYCRSRIPHLRTDTHENNRVMRHLLEKNGFRRCGVIYAEDGSPRVAYEWWGRGIFKNTPSQIENTPSQIVHSAQNSHRGQPPARK